MIVSVHAILANRLSPPLNQSPIATDAMALGYWFQSEIITVNYTYSDVDNDPEGATVVKAYRADDNSGTNATLIGTVTNKKYTIQAGDVGKYLRFGVTPVSSSGETTGSEAFSQWYGAVLASEFDIRASSGWLYGQNGVENFSAANVSGQAAITYNTFIRPIRTLNYQSPPQTLIYLADAAGVGNFFAVALGGYTSTLTNEYITVCKGSGRSGVVSTTESLLADGWFMITVGVYATGTKVFINGIEKTVTNSATPSTGGTSSLTFDRMSLSVQLEQGTAMKFNFKGKQCHDSIWNTELSSSEILDLYNSYTSNGTIAPDQSTYELSTHAKYSNVRKYFKRTDPINSGNVLAVDTVNPTQKLKWLPIAVWRGALSGNYNPLPPECDMFTRKIWQTTTINQDTYNHFSKIFEHNGRVYVMWDVHPYDEDGGGQFLKYVYSDNFGDTWSSPAVLFEGHDTIKTNAVGNRFLHPISWVVLGGELYATADVLENADLVNGFIGTLCRKINSDGTLGAIHWVQIFGGGTSVTPKSGFPSYPYDNTNWSAIVSYLTTQGRRASSGYSALTELQTKLNHTNNTYAANGGLIEQSEVKLPYGPFFRIWRNYTGGPGGTTYWTQYSHDGVTYLPAVASELPYPESMGTLRQFALNKIFLFGNPQNTGGVNRNPLMMAICGPDLDFKAQNIYTIRNDGHNARFTGLYKNGQFAYPSAILMSNGRIGLSYTTYGKEDIEFSSFIAPDLI